MGRMDQLEGKIAVVTGGGSGIGLALAHAFAAQGMKVVLADIEKDALDDAAEQIGAQHHGVDVHSVVCDVSDPDAVDRLRDETVATFGTAHVVCNNAGVGGGGQSWEIPLATWRWVLGVNLLGVVHGIHSFVPLMLEQGEGHVVNTASAAGLLTMPYMGPYAASKHAVVALTEGLAMELELAGGAVGASVLCPMWVKTRIHESERNAPPDVTAFAAPDTGAAAHATPDAAAGMRDLVAGLVTNGLDPAVVAEQVVGAVKGRRFYVLPHDEVKAGVLARAKRISEEASPELTFGG
jgi:NAD(P)-dependent dehydrogenase (short-subunit alcohol dehydrogenase family)